MHVRNHLGLISNQAQFAYDLELHSYSFLNVGFLSEKDRKYPTYLPKAKTISWEEDDSAV